MIEKDPKKEVERIIFSAQKVGISLRVLGGLAVCLTSPSATLHKQLKRKYADVDLVGLGQDERRLTALFIELGYEPNQRFNALHGKTRMIFTNPQDDSHIDVFLDQFQMCHTLDLRHRLLGGYLSLPLADLLITKLQIIQLNEKDLKDVLAILLDHELGAEKTDTIDLRYLSGLTSQSWGLYTTLGDNLQKVREKSIDLLTSALADRIKVRIDNILSEMEKEPKSLAWKLRARIGRKMEWYDLPDEVDR